MFDLYFFHTRKNLGKTVIFKIIVLPIQFSVHLQYYLHSPLLLREYHGKRNPISLESNLKSYSSQRNKCPIRIILKENFITPVFDPHNSQVLSIGKKCLASPKWMSGIWKPKNYLKRMFFHESSRIGYFQVDQLRISTLNPILV